MLFETVSIIEVDNNQWLANGYFFKKVEVRNAGPKAVDMIKSAEEDRSSPLTPLHYVNVGEFECLKFETEDQKPYLVQTRWLKELGFTKESTAWMWDFYLTLNRTLVTVFLADEMQGAALIVEITEKDDAPGKSTG